MVAELPDEVAGPVREHLLASHTTIEQVGAEVVEPAGVRHLVLNHLLSPILGPDEHWKRARRGFRGKLSVGRDLMTFTLPAGRR